MEFRVRYYGFLFFVASLCLLLSCHRQSRSNKKVFHYNEPSGIATLDPAFAKNQSVIWACHQIFNCLVETNDSLQVVPSLATRWEIAEDRLTYTFHLRTDVFFQDHPAFPDGKGRKCKASDVVYSFRRIIDPKVASPGAWIFNERIADAEAFKAVNDSTFQLKLKKPFSPILGVLSMKYCSIVPSEAVEFPFLAFRDHPCGTGPFRFSSWEKGQSLILIKNENYFQKDSGGQRPALSGCG